MTPSEQGELSRLLAEGDQVSDLLTQSMFPPLDPTPLGRFYSSVAPEHQEAFDAHVRRATRIRDFIDAAVRWFSAAGSSDGLNRLQQNRLVSMRSSNASLDGYPKEACIQDLGVVNVLLKKEQKRPSKPQQATPASGSSAAVPAVPNDVQRELLGRLTHTEDNFTERKTEANGRSDWRAAIVAFANSVPEGRTAVLYIGIANSGEIVGCSAPDQIQKTLNEICNRDCYPPITKYSVTALPVSGPRGDWVIAVEVRPSSDRPHFAGPAYIRSGSETVPASREIFEDLIASRNDKARAILKAKKSVVTVELFNTKLESPVYLPARHTPCVDCFLEDCDAFNATLMYGSAAYHIPLSEITISRDAERNNRLKLIVRATQ